MKKILLSILMVLILVFAGYGDVAAKENDNSEKMDETGHNFIFVCPILENEYWEECMSGMKQADDELGTVTKVIGPKTADNFASEIVEYMEKAIEEKPDGIIVYAGIDALSPLIEEAGNQGIPVLALDSDAPETSRVAYVGTDAFNAGYKAGEKLVEYTGGTAQVGVLVSSKSAEKEMSVMDAFIDAISDYDIEVVTIEETNADPDVAEAKTRELLEKYPTMTAIFNTAGYNVTGAARVKDELGLDNLILIGFDDVEENLYYVRKGVIDALLVQRIKQIGYQGVYLMNERVQNGELPKESYDTGTILVTKDNVDTYSSQELTLNQESKTVRIGYYNGDVSFQDGYDDNTRKSGYAYEYYQAIATITGWNYEYVYGTRAEMLEKLISGQVDIVAGIYQTDIRKNEMLFSNKDMDLDGEPRYFVINQDRTDLKTDLDFAMEEISSSCPNFTISLKQKYYSRTAQQVLTDSERAWLADKDKLTIGYVRENLPLSDEKEDGSTTGVINDLANLFEEYMRVEIVLTGYDSINDLEKALSENEVDVAFPIYSDLWLSEQNGFRQTDAFITDRVMIVYRGNYTDDMMNKVAVSATSIGQKYYMESNYPDSELVYYGSWKEGLDAVQNGKEKCIVGCSSILQRYLKEHQDYQNLNISYLDTSEEFGMAVRQDNSMLAGILNKAVRQLDTATITSYMMQYTGVEAPYTFMDFVRRYSIAFILFLSVFIAILLCVFIIYRRKNRIFNIEQEKSRKALEEALDTAKIASEAKTSFLSSMSHDIRTPMNAIIGMTEIAMRHLGDENRVEDCLKKISLSGNHLCTLINDILDISKIESGNLALNPVVFSIRDAITTLVNIVRPQIEEKHQTFEIHTHNMEYEMLYADEVRINQIFINLLSNAVKYTPMEGHIVLDLKEELQLSGETVKLTYVVKDNGIGMSEEYLEHMYDSFTRAQDSRINSIQGTGLGLTIVKQMVEMMNGSIECESQEGKGTTFTVTLDLPIREKTEGQLSLKGIKILIVDDDEIFLKNAVYMLEDMEAVVDTADTAEKTEKKVKQMHFRNDDYSVIMIDWKMPDTDSLELIRRIRDIVGDKIPILISSAYDWSDIEMDAKENGVDGFINKPLFKSYVHEEITDVLTKKHKSELNEPMDEESDLHGMNILVAEDNELNWEVITELLKMKGISSERAENGQVCFDKLNEAPEGTYDLILMDIQMPVLNGRDATRLIRKEAREDVRAIPIIAMTADAFAEDIAASLEAGMDGHIAKPVDMNVLFQEMRKFVRT